MLRAVLFDLFETLVTESRTRPAGVSSLASEFGCKRDAFRAEWKRLRPEVTVGRQSFRRALADIAIGLGGHAEEDVLQRVWETRKRTKAEPLAQIEPEVLRTVDYLRNRGLRLGVISNCFPEDVASWSQCPLGSRFDRTVFSFDVGLAKPDPAIYREAGRRLQVDPSEIWFFGDGADNELDGAEQAGLRAFKADWFVRRWPHFKEEPSNRTSVANIEDVVTLVERETTG